MRHFLFQSQHLHGTTHSSLRFLQLDDLFSWKPKLTKPKTPVLMVDASESESVDEPASPTPTKSATPKSTAVSAPSKNTLTNQAALGNEPFRVVAQCMIMRDGLVSGKKVSYFGQFMAFMPKANIMEAEVRPYFFLFSVRNNLLTTVSLPQFPVQNGHVQWPKCPRHFLDAIEIVL